MDEGEAFAREPRQAERDVTLSLRRSVVHDHDRAPRSRVPGHHDELLVGRVAVPRLAAFPELPSSFANLGAPDDGEEPVVKCPKVRSEMLGRAPREMHRSMNLATLQLR